MPEPLLATKLAVPRSQRRNVPRPRPTERLDRGLEGGARGTLVSAPAGFDKTTLVAGWVADCGRPTAWLSLDAADSDPSRFLAYLVGALQQVAPDAGSGALAVMGASRPPPLELAMTALVNDLDARREPITLVLDELAVWLLANGFAVRATEAESVPTDSMAGARAAA